jgi:hypothetical protein
MKLRIYMRRKQSWLPAATSACATMAISRQYCSAPAAGNALPVRYASNTVDRLLAHVSAMSASIPSEASVACSF